MDLKRSLVCISTILALLSCSKDKPTSPENESNKKENAYGTYETHESRTDNNGRARITSEITGENFDVITSDNNFNSIPNSDIHLYNDPNNILVNSLINQNSDYLPGFYYSSKSDLEERVNNSDILFEIISLYKSLNNFKEIYIGFSEDAPSFDENHMLNIYGILYEGDWSFNEARNVSNLLNKSLMILVPVIPGAKSLSIATGITSTVADKMNDVIDFMNQSPYIEIDKNEKLEFYTIPGFNIVFFLPKLPNNSTRNVIDYIRDEQGDWWDYSNNLTLEIDGFKTLNEKNIPIFKDNQGTEAYQGFDSVFSRIYGNKIEYNNQTYEFIYQPQINFGDDRIGRNKIYPNSIMDINTGRYANISYKWVGIDGVTTPAGRFDNCWKVEEISGNNIVTRWYAKDVGQVKIKSGNIELLLESYGSGGLPNNPLSIQDGLDYSYLLLGSFVR